MKTKRTNWWFIVFNFAVQMITRFEAKDECGWEGFDNVKESEYKLRIIKNVVQGNYVDAANLSLLASRVEGRG